MPKTLSKVIIRLEVQDLENNTHSYELLVTEFLTRDDAEKVARLTKYWCEGITGCDFIDQDE